MPITLRSVLCALPPLLMAALLGCALTGRPPISPSSLAPTLGARSPVPGISAADLRGLAGPTVTESGLEAARRQRRNGEMESALALYREVVASGDHSAQVLLELGQVEIESSQPAAARHTLAQVLSSATDDVMRQRASLGLAAADLALGNWDSVLDEADPARAPDGLADLAAVYRAEAMLKAGKQELARLQLGRKEVSESANRVMLERAGSLAEQAGDPGLAGELYRRGSNYPGWTIQRTRLIEAAAAAFDRAGRGGEAIEQYRRLVETYTWTKAGQRAGERLVQLEALTAYEHGLLDLNYRSPAEAREALKEAAVGPDTAAAQQLLARIEQGAAWGEATDVASAEAYRSFRTKYPKADMASEAWFREGMAYYAAGRLLDALRVWEEAVPTAVSGDSRARLLLWMGKALGRMGREADGRARWQEAAGTSPAGYYAVRARDLLAGRRGWPEASAIPAAGTGGAAPRGPDQLPGPAGPVSPETDVRVGRGRELLALGLRAEASAEMDGLIADSQDGGFLLQMAEELTAAELWSSAAKAAARVATLSPAKTLASAPPTVQRLAYPTAYPDLVCTHSRSNSLDPLLLLALMRQESSYDPYALSVSDARGLTQVIPSTGRGIASTLGRPDFAPDDLYRPAVGVQFGAWYLGDQLKRFNGDPFLAIAAYNAGGGPVPRWANADPDLYVERIDYAQTRDYVRQVYLHYAIYQSLGLGQICA